MSACWYYPFAPEQFWDVNMLWEEGNFRSPFALQPAHTHHFILEMSKQLITQKQLFVTIWKIKFLKLVTSQSASQFNY